MALPQGINFRATQDYVTDDANDYAQLLSSLDYPTTTPQGQNVGWESGTVNYTNDRDSGVDARLAGTHGFNLASTATYRIDLPSVGDYIIRSAMGSAAQVWRVEAELYDGTTLLRNLATDRALAGGQFVDATDVVIADAANWVSNNASVTESFATTILRVTIPAGSDFRTIAHLYVESASGGIAGIIGESVTALDGQSATVVFSAARTESSAAADNLFSTFATGSTASEVAAASEISTQTVSVQSAVVESGATVDTNTSCFMAPVNVTEAGSLSDNVSNTYITTSAQSESAAFTDSQNASQPGTSTVTESLAAAESNSAASILNAVLSEIASFADVVAELSSFSASTSESSGATDSQNTLLSAFVSTSESSVLAELQGAAISTLSSISELVSLADAWSAAIGDPIKILYPVPVEMRLFNKTIEIR